jgi:double-stranded uracil-DNA glycosylase
VQRIAFPPVARDDARVLILGSLPGGESLRRGEYYGLAANRFWWIMGELAGAGPDLPYADRLERLRQHRIALWDVCASAFRPGSLDSNILLSSVTPNDFATFFAAHPQIALIAFNGRPAEKLYRNLVLKTLPPASAALPRAVLPSSSPAHAAMPPAAKLAQWHLVLGGFVG